MRGDDEKYKSGIKVGSTAAGIGGSMLLLGKVLKDNYEGKGLFKYKKYRNSIKKFLTDRAKEVGTTPESLIKSNRNLGLALAGAGGALAGYSTYKHYKNKKNRDDSSEE